MPTTFDPTATAAPIGSFVKTDDGEVINDTSYQELEFKPLARGVRYMELHAALDTTAAGALGDVDDANPADFQFSGTVRILDNGDGLAKLHIDAGTSLLVDPDGFVRAQSRKRMLRQRVPATGTLSNADHTIDVSQGDRFVLSGAPSNRVITVSKATGAPEEGETMTAMWVSVQEGSSNTTQYTFKRDDGTTIATAVTNSATAASTAHRWVEFEYCLISTGPNVYDWRLGPNSGMGWDGTADYGIIPGASA